MARGAARPAIRDGFSPRIACALIARHENGNSDETCSSPCNRVGSDNADLVATRTERSQVIDGGLQGAARIRSRHGTPTRVNFELSIRRGCPSGRACHGFNFPPRRAAKRSSSSRASGPSPHWRIKSRMPSGHRFTVDLTRRTGRAPLPSRQGTATISPVPLPHNHIIGCSNEKSPFWVRITRLSDRGAQGITSGRTCAG